MDKKHVKFLDLDGLKRYHKKLLAALEDTLKYVKEIENKIDLVADFVSALPSDNKTYGIKNGVPELIAEVGEAVVTVDEAASSTLELPADKSIEVPVAMTEVVQGADQSATQTLLPEQTETVAPAMAKTNKRKRKTE